MEERKLATIEVIKDLQPIEGADAIEVATVRGWKVVVKKGEFQVGDLCVYCEIDSIMPERPEFYFLQTSHFRIKTIKLRGQVSQGICFPFNILQNVNVPDSIKFGTKETLVGMDITNILGVTKYEPPIPAQLAGKVKGNFPSFLKKTDVERLQNMEFVLSEYKDELFYVTEKVDGTSFTAYYKDGVFGICSRNLDLFETEDNTYWRVARKLKLEEKMKAYRKNIALQGELVGEGIQKNKYTLKGQTVYFFDMFDIDSYSYMNSYELSDFAYKNQLHTVPGIVRPEGSSLSVPATLHKLKSSVEEMLKFAEGKSLLNPLKEREGIVIRPEKEIEHPKYGRISFKVISNKYLLKYED